MTIDVRALFDATTEATKAKAEAKAAATRARRTEQQMFFASFREAVRPLDGLGGAAAGDGYGSGYRNGERVERPHQGVWIDQHEDAIHIGHYRYHAEWLKPDGDTAYAHESAPSARLVIRRSHSGQPWDHETINYASIEEAARAFAVELGKVAGSR